MQGMDSFLTNVTELANDKAPLRSSEFEESSGATPDALPLPVLGAVGRHIDSARPADIDVRRPDRTVRYVLCRFG
jgi:hypothetical protein